MKRAVMLALVIGCGEATEPSPSAEPVSTGNDPIEVALSGRTVRVRCEIDCTLVGRELDQLRDGCVHSPNAVPGILAIDGESLRGWGCCHEADHAYTTACGDEESRCTTGWLAACEHATLGAHASGHGSGAPPAEAPE